MVSTNHGHSPSIDELTKQATSELDEQYGTRQQVNKKFLSEDEYDLLHSYWQAANYISTAQIYLKENCLLTEKLRKEHIKPRLLGHFGTSVGLNLVYTHLNRLIKKTGQSILFVTGPGHGGPANVAQTWLEGSYTEIYPKIQQDANGVRSLCRQFSTPGGIPSHASANTPGSINEGGELGYCLVHAFGAVFDDPDLIAATVVGDGEAETGPLEGSWKSINFLNPRTDGAVLPILHLNGYKISGPTVLARYSDDQLTLLFSGHGYNVHFMSGDDPAIVHHLLAETLEKCYDEIKTIQKDARSSDKELVRPRWPMIIMRTPKGWTGPLLIDGKQVEGTFRSHQVPLTSVLDSDAHMEKLESWLKSYQPDIHFKGGKIDPRFKALIPAGNLRMGMNPASNAGTVKQLNLPDFTQYAYEFDKPAQKRLPSTEMLGTYLRDIYKKNPTNFRLMCPDETNSNKLGAVFENETRCLVSKIYPNDDHVSPSGRVMEVLSEHLCEGWLEGYTLTGRHGMFATYEAFALIVGSMASQHAKWLEVCNDELPWRRRVPSLNILLTSTCWRNDHNGFSHQGPGFMDVILSKKGTVSRVYLPPDAQCLMSVAAHCLQSTNYINLIVIDKQPQLQYLSIEEAVRHCAAGASIWHWASSHDIGNCRPHVVLASAGDIPTQELLAAADWLRHRAPELMFRFVNVVDLMALYSRSEHPHGMGEDTFTSLFGSDLPVVFVFHGYVSAIHHLVHERPSPSRFYVRGYEENGTTTTPFMMTALNRISRWHLVELALQIADPPPPNAENLKDEAAGLLKQHKQYAFDHFTDADEITNWTWGAAQ